MPATSAGMTERRVPISHIETLPEHRMAWIHPAAVEHRRKLYTRQDAWRLAPAMSAFTRVVDALCTPEVTSLGALRIPSDPRRESRVFGSRGMPRRENYLLDRMRIPGPPRGLYRGPLRATRLRSFTPIQICRDTALRQVSEIAHLPRMLDCQEFFSHTTECIILARDCGRRPESDVDSKRPTDALHPTTADNDSRRNTPTRRGSYHGTAAVRFLRDCAAVYR